MLSILPKIENEDGHLPDIGSLYLNSNHYYKIKQNATKALRSAETVLRPEDPFSFEASAGYLRAGLSKNLLLLI
jgi:hypothetical protein